MTEILLAPVKEEDIEIKPDGVEELETAHCISTINYAVSNLALTESCCYGEFLVSKFKHPHATLTRWLKNAMRLLEKHYEVAQVLDEVAQLAIMWSFSLKLVVHGLVAIIG